MLHCNPRRLLLAERKQASSTEVHQRWNITLNTRRTQPLVQGRSAWIQQPSYWYRPPYQL